MRATILLGAALVTALSLAGSSLALVNAISTVAESQEFAIDATLDFATAIAEDAGATAPNAAGDALVKAEAMQALAAEVAAHAAGDANGAAALGTSVTDQVYGDAMATAAVKYNAAHALAHDVGSCVFQPAGPVAALRCTELRTNAWLEALVEA